MIPVVINLDETISKDNKNAISPPQGVLWLAVFKKATRRVYIFAGMVGVATSHQ